MRRGRRFRARKRFIATTCGWAKAQWRQSGAWIETTTPRIELLEVVAIDL